jgi:hypothetical protein
MKCTGTLVALCILALLCFVFPTAAQNGSGMSVTCDSGVTFDNGVEIVVNQMRAGFTQRLRPRPGHPRRSGFWSVQ